MSSPTESVDPDELAVTITYLEARSDPAFAQALAENVLDPDPVATAAFRSPQLATRSLSAARFVINRANNRIRNADSTPDPARTRYVQTRLRDAVGFERASIQAVVDNMVDDPRGAHGNAPSARSRAMRRMAREDPVRFLRFRREAEEQIAAERRAAKAQRKEQQAAERAARARGEDFLP